MTDLKIIHLEDIREEHRKITGGKALSLSKLIRNRISVPPGICLTTDIYKSFIETTGLDGKIILELNRKPFREMRWEEIWDLSLRIRNFFLSTDLPGNIEKKLVEIIDTQFGSKKVAVRSSSPSEDSSETSFAGLHESFINITGTSSIINRVKLVWASLWSDAALLYRKELALDVKKSSMAVVIQELVNGQRSGVTFSENPMRKGQAVVESVWGLNEGLVDGTVEPDRWILSREDGRIISHTEPSSRDFIKKATESGTATVENDPESKDAPPLKDEEVSLAFQMALSCENMFEAPQDVEWTSIDDRFFLLQSRPVTKRSNEEDERGKYLSLKVSFEELKKLRELIEDELLPEMEREAGRMKEIDLRSLSNTDLAGEIRRRLSILEKWNRTYEKKFIPFAHGTRLFGSFYNDSLSPEDPFEFVLLLQGTEMKSLKRNRTLMELAKKTSHDRQLKKSLIEDTDIPTVFEESMKPFAMDFHLSSGEDYEKARTKTINFILEMSGLSLASSERKSQDKLYKKYLNAFADEKSRKLALEYLELARASWKLRDDDNIYLAAIENEVNRSIMEGRERLAGNPDYSAMNLPVLELCLCLENPDHKPDRYLAKTGSPENVRKNDTIFYRQAKGQPAGPGKGSGVAKVIKNKKDLLAFKKGQILICDAIEPDMTFIVPLAAGIVERRGGMLIHGAIIAREYGIPCVTGVPDATEIIPDGATVTVDGYLGLVIVEPS